MIPQSLNSRNSSDIFNFLSKSCKAVSRQPSVENFVQLGLKLQNLKCAEEKIGDQALFRYVTFPLEVAFGKSESLREDVLIEAFHCYREAVNSWTISEGSTCHRILHWCSKFLSSGKASSGPESIREVCEELKISVVLCLNSAFLATPKVQLLSRENLSLVGFSISLLLGLAQYERNRELRAYSLETLSLLFEVQIDDHSDLDRAVDSLAFYVPGLATGICKIVTSDTRPGHQVIVEAIRLLKLVIQTTLNDKGNRPEKSTSAPSNSNLNSKGCKMEYLIVTRTSDWYNRTANNLNILLQKIFSIVMGMENMKVLHGCIVLSEAIVNHCFKSMNICVSSCIEYLIHLVGMKSDLEVDCHNILENISTKLQADGPIPLEDIMKEKFMNLVMQLPRIMHGSLESQRQAALHQFIGYLVVLHSSLDTVLSSNCHLEKLLKGFSQILECSDGDQKVLVCQELERDSRLSSFILDKAKLPALKSVEWKFLKWLNDTKTLNLFSQACHLLIQGVNLFLLFDCTRDLFVSSTIFRKQAGVLFAEFLNAISRIKNVDESVVQSLVDQVISLYLTEEYWHLPTYNVEDSKDLSLSIENRLNNIGDSRHGKSGISISQLNSNIQLICIMLEGIQACSTICGEKFRIYLMQILYPILEKVGDENVVVSEVAMSTLQSMSKDLKYESVAHLILENADYLVDSAVFHLQHMDIFSSAPGVTKAIIDCLNVDALHTIKDIFEEVYISLEVSKNDTVYILLGILKHLNKNIYEKYTEPLKESKFRSSNTEPTQKVQNKGDVSLKAFFEEQCSLQRVAMGHAKAEDSRTNDSSDPADIEALDNNDSDIVDSEEDPKVPWELNVTVKNVEKSLHFLNSPSNVVKQRVLDVIKYGLLSLRTTEKALLPMIHQVWPCLKEETRSSNKMIRLKAIEVLRVTVLCSKDFMRQRLCKEFIPYSMSFLRGESMQSFKVGKSYRFTLACKLQLELLTFLGSALYSLNLSDADLFEMFRSCIPYKSPQQPKVLQEAAEKLLDNLREINYGLFWYGNECIKREAKKNVDIIAYNL